MSEELLPPNYFLKRSANAVSMPDMRQVQRKGSLERAPVPPQGRPALQVSLFWLFFFLPLFSLFFPLRVFVVSFAPLAALPRQIWQLFFRRHLSLVRWVEKLL